MSFVGMDKQTYAQYDLERELGRGASAAIYLARCRATGESVSLKVFHPGLFKDPHAAARIRREFKALTTLVHPHIVPVRALLTDVEPPALVMDYIDGENLETFQMRLPYTLPEVSVLIVMQILEALEGAHAAGVLHRDLKPENVLIRRDGTVFVTDFGLAKFLDASTNITQPNHIVGSADYMSPEQASGDVLTPLSDLFSVASILYFLTTGTRPFARPTPIATFSAIRTDTPEAPEKRNPKICGELSRLLQRGLAKDPAARFESATAFREALESYLDGVGLSGEVFSLAGWMKDPGGGTGAAVRAAVEAITHRAEAAAKCGQWSALLELIAHLSVKAPESPAIPRLMAARRKSRALKIYVMRGAAAVLALVLLTFAFQRARVAAQPVASPMVADGAGASAPSAAPGAARAGLAPIPVVTAMQPERLGEVHFRVARGTKVLWDGNAIDPSVPLKAVALGKHEMVLKLKGFDPIRRTIHVTGDEPVVINAR